MERLLGAQQFLRSPAAFVNPAGSTRRLRATQDLDLDELRPTLRLSRLSRLSAVQA
jgi:hypothetical protein